MNETMKVTAINLFDMDGDITVLELWNDSAILGVRFLWEQLGNENEILLQFKSLDPPRNEKKKKFVTPTLKRVEPNTFQRDMYSFPVKARIIADVPTLGATCELKDHCKRILIPPDMQILCDELPIRHFSMWHKTIQEQQEEDNPDDLQRLIMSASGLNVLMKRKHPEPFTKPDKGYKPLDVKQEEDQHNEEDLRIKKQNTTEATKASNDMDED